LTSRSLEIKVRVRYLKLSNESGFEDFLAHFLHVVGLDFKPDRSCGPQELALIRDIPVEKSDIEVFSQTKEVSLGIGFRDFAPEDITIKLTNTVPILPWN
jgi:hypothetical protein